MEYFCISLLKPWSKIVWNCPALNWVQSLVYLEGFNALYYQIQSVAIKLHLCISRCVWGGFYVVGFFWGWLCCLLGDFLLFLWLCVLFFCFVFFLHRMKEDPLPFSPFRLFPLRSGKAGGFAVSLERNWWNSVVLSALSAKAALIERYPIHRAISSLRQAALSGCLRRNPGLGAAP